LEAATETREPRRQTAQNKDEGAVVNILVVDDSINTREIEKSILESYGYRVTLAEDGADGLEKAKGFIFDAVITDVEMPRLDGFSLTERLRKEESYRNTPIIIVTSREKEEDKRRGIQVGADAYIVKGSFDQTSLLETVQNLIG
jgi:two-component system chemotaxis sensor kinase CheA